MRYWTATKQPLAVTEEHSVLTPDQFEINEAWIFFRLNDVPIHTEQDGDFNFLALMDVASCFILGSAPLSAQAPELTQAEASQLLEEGRAHKQQLPKTLFVPATQPAEILSQEAERLGITVVRVAEDQLLVFTSEAKEGFKEHFSSGGKR